MSKNLSNKCLADRTSHRNYMVTLEPLFVNWWKDILLYPQSIGETSRVAIHCGRIDSTHIIPCDARLFCLFGYFKNVISIDGKIRRLCHSWCWLLGSIFRDFGGFGDLVLFCFMGFGVSFDTWDRWSYCTKYFVTREWGLASGVIYRFWRFGASIQHYFSLFCICRIWTPIRMCNSFDTCVNPFLSRSFHHQN